MAEVRLPVVGGVSKKALAIGGGSAALLIGVIYLRKRKSQSAPAATGDTTGTDTTGSGDYVDPGLQDTSQGPVYGSTGYYDPNTGQWVYGSTGTGQAAATTNQAWAQNAIAYLSGQGADPGALSAALGAYLAGQPVSSDQVSLIDQAIAAEGYPPQAGPSGYPPGINESGTPSQGGTGGSGGGVTGSGSDTGSTGSGDTSSGTGGTPAPAPASAPKAAGAISNLQSYNVTKSGFSARWNKAAGATGGYRYIVTQLNGAHVHEGVTRSTSVSISNLHPGWTYNFGIQALPGGPGNNIHVALPSK